VQWIFKPLELFSTLAEIANVMDKVMQRLDFQRRAVDFLLNELSSTA
jgi:hypothetical protein